MKALLTVLLLAIACLGISQMPGLVCVDTNSSSNGDSIPGTPNSDEHHSSASAEDDCEDEQDCDHCQICHRALAVVAFYPMTLGNSSLPSDHGKRSTLHQLFAFDDSLLDPPRFLIPIA